MSHSPVDHEHEWRAFQDMQGSHVKCVQCGALKQSLPAAAAWPNGETKAVTTMCQEIEAGSTTGEDLDDEMVLMISLTRPNYWTVSVLLYNPDPEVEPDPGDVRAACEAARVAGNAMLGQHGG